MNSLSRLPQPCPSCPWRRDQTAADIPNFDIERARGLASTSPCKKGFGPDFSAKIFACHQSKPDDEFSCAGWLAMVGSSHPRVRLAVMQGEIPKEHLAPGKDWPALHDNYPEVLEKLELTNPGE